MKMAAHDDKRTRLRPCRGCGEEFFFAEEEDYCTEQCEDDSLRLQWRWLLLEKPGVEPDA